MIKTGFRLKKPITVKITCDGEVWCFENEDLEIYGCGKSFEEASKDFKTIFDTLIESYVVEAEV